MPLENSTTTQRVPNDIIHHHHHRLPGQRGHSVTIAGFWVENHYRASATISNDGGGHRFWIFFFLLLLFVCPGTPNNETTNTATKQLEYNLPDDRDIAISKAMEANRMDDK